MTTMQPSQSSIPLPNIQTILQMLLQQLQTPSAQTGTAQQQMMGLLGGLGGPAGSPYGLYGALYGTRLPQAISNGQSQGLSGMQFGRSSS